MFFRLSCDNHMLHLSVKIIIPYKGLHLCLAIIPEEYNIIIYCHREWQWETVLLYSIAKQRKGSEVDSVSCICSYSMCMLVLQKSLTVPSRLVSNRMQKYIYKKKKSCTMRREFVPKKNATRSDEYKNG